MADKDVDYNSGRFHVMSAPAAAPGKCGICGTADIEKRESFIDVGLTFEFYGVLYFCNECVLDMAHQYGYITPSEAALLEAKFEALTAENVALKSRLKASEAYIASVFAVDPDTLVVSDLISPTENDSVDEEGHSDEGSDDSDAIKPAAVKRSDDVRYPDGSTVGGSLSL